MGIVRAFLPAVVVGLVLASWTPFTAVASDPVQWRADPSDEHAVIAEVDIHASLGHTWELLSTLEGWPDVFSDVKAVRIDGRRASVTDVTLDSKAIGHPGAWTFTAREAIRLNFSSEGHGVRLDGGVELSPAGDSRSTHAVFRLRIAASGLAGIFAAQKRLHRGRAALHA